MTYQVRSIFLSLGSTLFCLRLLINRLAKYWLPPWIYRGITEGYKLYKNIWPSQHAPTYSGMSYVHMTDDDSPVYRPKSVLLGDINDLIVALQDPHRLEILRDLATKALMMESVDFICKVLEYKARAEELMVQSSSVASDEMKTQALVLYSQYLQANSPDEVNVSAATRGVLRNQFDLWIPNLEMISKEVARSNLEADTKHRVLVFEPAYREVLIMLYQNLWTKFQIAEATAYALYEDNTNESASIAPLSIPRNYLASEKDAPPTRSKPRTESQKSQYE